MTELLTDEQLNAMPLSALIRLAVNDAQAAEDQGVVLDMSAWLETANGTCRACMAGAVMHQRQGLSELPDDTDKALWLMAINRARTGEIACALYILTGNYHLRHPAVNNASDLIRTCYASSGHETFRASWPTYMIAASMLEAGGL